jgi:hypothetical protein
MGRVSGRMPSRLRTERQQRAGQAAEEVGFGTCRGERKANAAGGLDDTGGDFKSHSPHHAAPSSRPATTLEARAVFVWRLRLDESIFARKAIEHAADSTAQCYSCAKAATIAE